MVYDLQNVKNVIIRTQEEEKSFTALENAVWNDVCITSCQCDNGLEIWLEAAQTPVKEIILCWRTDFLSDDAKVLSDAWERTYGENVWSEINEKVWMPWYFFVNQNDMTWGCGVKTNPNALCCWNLSDNILQLKLDVRCGGMGVVLRGRKLKIATLLQKKYEGCTAFQAACAFCKEMCSNPVFPDKPVYGTNNWYYAYGISSEEDMLREADETAKLTEGLENRAYVVVDDGWQSLHSGSYNGGPWKEGNESFPDMERLAKKITERNLLPGLWFRPLLNQDSELKEEWKSARDNHYLDPSRPEVLDYIAKDMDRFMEWGYKLVKYDFTTFDIFGRWGFEMTDSMAKEGWTFADRSKTTAEIIQNLYRTIYEHAKGAVVLGCNCIGHLGTGYMHSNRSGDDTSGLEWERTLKMGVHTTAFRLPQHRAFYDIDCDCVGIVPGKIPWEKNGQWLKLLAKSGTPLFISVKPGVLSASEEAEIKEAYRLAAVQEKTIEPLDWMETAAPHEWKYGEAYLHFEW